jgi:hypothetical protein
MEAQLRDIHLPEPVSWWPLAPGWWLVCIATLVMLFLLWRLWQKHKYNLQQQSLSTALNTLSNIENQQDLNDKALIQQLSILLRRTAITRHGRKKIAGLTGEKWLHFLDQQGKTNSFTQGTGRVFKDQPYRASVKYDRKRLLQLVKQWIKAQQGGQHV